MLTKYQQFKIRSVHFLESTPTDVRFKITPDSEPIPLHHFLHTPLAASAIIVENKEGIYRALLSVAVGSKHDLRRELITCMEQGMSLVVFNPLFSEERGTGLPDQNP